MLPVYFDHNATTPPHAEVIKVMISCLEKYYGNPASHTHAFGWQAAAAIDTAREQIATLLACTPSEIIFTSGATEAINIGLRGAALAMRHKGNHIISSSTEHTAVLQTLDFLSKNGFTVTYLDVNNQGLPNLDELRKSSNDKTILYCFMWANNETGILNPVNEISQIANEKSIVFFSDATQAAGKTEINLNLIKADLLCISSHKFYGPKGAGALFIRKKKPPLSLVPVIFGGSHEKYYRPGTMNVPALAGMGKAAEMAHSDLHKFKIHTGNLQNIIESGLTKAGCKLNGSNSHRLCNTSNFTLPCGNADLLMSEVSNFAFSAGSACTSGTGEPSHVLKAMSLNSEEINRSFRISTGWQNNDAQMFDFVNQIQTFISNHNNI